MTNTGQAAAYFHQAQRGFIRLGGADRIDFLQRQTTNDMGLLGPANPVWTVLTSAKARIVDLLCVMDEGESLLVLPLPGRHQATLQFLKQRIFFMDKVTLEDVSSSYAHVQLVGSSVSDVFSGMASALPEGLRVITAPESLWGGINLVVRSSAQSELLATLEQAGLPGLDADVSEILRVEAGLPGAAGELTEAFTPHEIRLGDLISTSKGCYTGQEILTRQVTYDKVAKLLVMVRLSSPALVGAEVFVAEKKVGVLTSSLQSPRFGAIGLAVLRKPADQPGTKLTFQTPDGTVDGEVIQQDA